MHDDLSVLLPATIEWRRDSALVPYRTALETMAARNAAIAEGAAAELVWLLEHPPVYTAGTSAAPDELLDPRFEVVSAGRGGRYTYHGPGQRIGYVLLDLKTRARDVRGFVHALEGWVIDTLADFGVDSWRSPGRVGIWTRDIDGREAKIGAIGVRIRRWVTMHGFSVNLAPDLSHFGGIVPCGIDAFGVTSLARLGHAVSPDAWDRALLRHAPAFLAALDRPCPALDAPASNASTAAAPSACESPR
ncbi:lipoyl(octanoyl) transferase LipB [Novosphingobium piscinae]|uniref:Octanoyltransferase n=1 Tax=Novosphingobium piscinae TaxID=1507448 RepID=A0A7X1G1E4_9SPHN|nr:lipoyl(octanoyl) transferase LipB [Novosphingobium piscinae]MBC2670894.1 lipoyl(octanoyl) transferase LipB [Novosphingobium piscinae]